MKGQLPALCLLLASLGHVQSASPELTPSFIALENTTLDIAATSLELVGSESQLLQYPLLREADNIIQVCCHARPTLAHCLDDSQGNA
jgi:hypothetical protein